MNVPDIVYTVWGLLLLVTFLLVLPLVLFLLHRTFTAARYIEHYLAGMAQAGQGIAENTRPVQDLEETIQVAAQMLEVAGNLEAHTHTIAVVLGQRANGVNGTGKGGPQG